MIPSGTPSSSSSQITISFFDFSFIFFEKPILFLAALMDADSD